MEQSVSGLGYAYSGMTSGGEDISVMFYNPAGLSEYRGMQVVSGGFYVFPRNRFKSDQSADRLNQPLTGGDGANSGQQTLIPSLYAATDLTDRLRFGVGITVPFGLGARYAKTWKGRYEAINSQLRTFDINPVLSYKVNDQISIGFGLNAQNIHLLLSQAIDFGSICIAQIDMQTCSGLGLLPQAADGKTELKADGWSWGYQLGGIVKPLPGLKMGIAFRSKVKHRVDGRSDFNVPENARPLTASGAFQNTPVTAKSNLPARLAFGATYQLNQDWALMTDIAWTQWNQIDNLTIRFENPAQPQSPLDLNFKNTIWVAYGFRYDLNDHWTLRTGFAFDESPVRNPRSRTFRIPDSNRYWLTFGVSYHYNSNFKFDFGYAHIFFQDANIERQSAFGHQISGQIETQIDILSAQLQWTF